MMSARDFIDWIRPPDLSDGASDDEKAAHRNDVNRYRWNVTLSILGLFTFAAWALTDWGFARASEIDPRVKRALEPLQAEIAAIKKAQSDQGQQLDDQNGILKLLSSQLNAQLRENTASQIRLLVSQRCKKPVAEERERLNREIERYQDVYKQYANGERYTIRCDEL